MNNTVGRGIAVVFGLGMFIAAVWLTLKWFDYRLLIVIMLFWWVSDINQKLKTRKP